MKRLENVPPWIPDQETRNMVAAPVRAEIAPKRIGCSPVGAITSSRRTGGIPPLRARSPDIATWQVAMPAPTSVLPHRIAALEHRTQKWNLEASVRSRDTEADGRRWRDLIEAGSG
jgi:hypothetical protein